MDKTIANILGDALPEEIRAELQEAFEKKVAAQREELEMSLREEFGRLYEHDKATLVEALDRMLSNVVQKHETERQAEIKKFVEARNVARKVVKEANAKAKASINESAAAHRKFVMEKLTKEVASLKEQKKLLAKKANTLAEGLEVHKAALSAEYAKRIKKIDEFVVKKITQELNEFQQDKKALVSARAKLIAEGRKKLQETQKVFVANATKKAFKMVNENLKREMTQLHEDLEKNRQNMFGRRIFEAVAAEYMTSYLAEGTEIRNLQTVLEAKTAELAATKQKLDESSKTIDAASRKARLAEDKATRTKIMSELLSNLRGEKRTVMEGMLETTKTENLRESFNKLLPVVLNEATRKEPAPQGKKTLTENQSNKTRLVTGDQRGNRLNETANTESDDFDTEIAQVIRLAGIQK